MSTHNSRHNLAFAIHDHRICQHQRLIAAQDLCAKRNLRLTPRRLQVFKILLQSHQPMGAYDILGCLNQAETSSFIAPPIVYRALEFLLAQGLVHRIESKNAFISCDHPGHKSAAQFLICRGCEKVAELDNATSLIPTEALEIGFTADHSVVEITGVCADCNKHGN